MQRINIKPFQSKEEILPKSKTLKKDLLLNPAPIMKTALIPGKNLLKIKNGASYF